MRVAGIVVVALFATLSASAPPAGAQDFRIPTVGEVVELGGYEAICMQ